MEKYELTIADIKNNANRFLAYIYATARRSEKPEIDFIVAGPGAGKSGVESYLKNKLKEEDERCAIVNSDKIAEFHPDYEDAIEELPEVCYKVTRQFVRPATPIIFSELRNNNINILNENTFDKGQGDIDFVKDFIEAGYKIKVHIIATDMFISRLSCYEREARMLQNGDTPRGISKETQTRMYNSFIDEIAELERLGYCDELNVYIRGENINKPELVYQLGEDKYRDFKEAIIEERKKQRKKIFANPSEYLAEIRDIRQIIEKNGINEVLTNNSLKGLDELQKDFIEELAKENESDIEK